MRTYTVHQRCQQLSIKVLANSSTSPRKGCMICMDFGFILNDFSAQIMQIYYTVVLMSVFRGYYARLFNFVGLMFFGRNWWRNWVKWKYGSPEVKRTEFDDCTSENANRSATSLVHSKRRVSWRVNLRTETGTVVTFASWPASLSHKVITWDSSGFKNVKTHTYKHTRLYLPCDTNWIDGIIIIDLVLSNRAGCR